MSLIIAITGHELRRALRDRALPWLLVLFAILAAYGAWNGAQWAKTRTQTVQLVAQEATDNVAQKRKLHAEAEPGSPMFFLTPQTTAFRPVLAPAPMAALSIGQAEAYPYAARMQPLSDLTMFDAFKVDVDNPAVRAAGRFDLAFVIVFLLPLIVMAGTFDLWARECERGIAGLVASQPIAMLDLLAGKALARTLVLVLPATLTVLAALWIVGARDPVALTAVGIVVAGYGLFWIALAVLINVFAKRTTDAALAGGAAWLTLVVLAPALVLSTLDIVAPAPSALQFASAYRAESQEIRKAQRLAREAKAPETPRDPAPRIPDRTRAFLVEREIEEARLAPMVKAHEDAQSRRRSALDMARLFLPAVATQDALDRIAGSDADRALSFQRQVLAFKAGLRPWLVDRFDRDQLMTLDDYDHLPRFQFHEPRGGAFQSGVLIDLAALLAASLLLIAGVVLGRRAATSL